MVYFENKFLFWGVIQDTSSFVYTKMKSILIKLNKPIQPKIVNFDIFLWRSKTQRLVHINAAETGGNE